MRNFADRVRTVSNRYSIHTSNTGLFFPTMSDSPCSIVRRVILAARNERNMPNAAAHIWTSILAQAAAVHALCLELALLLLRWLRRSNLTLARVLCLQPAEAAVIASVSAEERARGMLDSREHARRVFVLNAVDCKRRVVNPALAARYSAWVDEVIDKQGQRVLPFDFEKKFDWWVCTRALGLGAAYGAPALASDGSKPPPWLGCVAVYTSWQRAIAADMLACLAEAGLLDVATSVGQQAPEPKTAAASVAASSSSGAEASLTTWLSTALAAFTERFAIDQAIIRGQPETVAQLLDAMEGAVIDEPLPDWPPSGDIALHVAAGHGHMALIQMLLARRAAVDPPNFDGVRPLHRAASKGSAEAVALLLAHHAALDGRATAKQSSALHLAASNGRSAVAKLLISQGADTTARDANGDTPLELAICATSADPCCGGDGPGRDYSGLITILETLGPMTPAARRTSALRSWELFVCAAVGSRAHGVGSSEGSSASPLWRHLRACPPRQVGMACRHWLATPNEYSLEPWPLLMHARTHGLTHARARPAAAHPRAYRVIEARAAARRERGLGAALTLPAALELRRLLQRT